MKRTGEITSGKHRGESMEETILTDRGDKHARRKGRRPRKDHRADTRTQEGMVIKTPDTTKQHKKTIILNHDTKIIRGFYLFS